LAPAIFHIIVRRLTQLDLLRHSTHVPGQSITGGNSYATQSNYLSSPFFTQNPFLSLQASTEWTWSGANTQISEIEKMRSRAAKPKENLYKASLQTKLRYDADVVDDFPRDLPTKPSGAATNKSLLSKLNPFKRKLPSQMKRHSLFPGSELDPQKYLRSTMNGRASVSSLSRNYLTQHRPSVFAVPCLEEEQDLLETTTIADLIRAIESVHADSVVTASSSRETLDTGKQRKLGTDHLPPRRQSMFVPEGRNAANLTIHGPTSDILPLKAAHRNRLYSCVSTPTPSYDNGRGRILGDSSPFMRRGSAARPPPPYTSPTSQPESLKSSLKRRFSVRPADLENAPGQVPRPQNAQITVPTSQQATGSPVMAFQRKLSWHPKHSALAGSENAKSGRQRADSTSTAKPT
jgi:hypothetical protein